MILLLWYKRFIIIKYIYYIINIFKK
jgi:hypothetical protein